MNVKKGTHLLITHSRKGEFRAVALEDFATEDRQWWPVATLQLVKGHPRGTKGSWKPDEEIPCRASFVSKVEVIE